MTVNEKMTELADAIRSKTGGVDPLSIDGMIEAINSLGNNEITCNITYTTSKPDAKDIISKYDTTVLYGESYYCEYDFSELVNLDYCANVGTIIMYKTDNSDNYVTLHTSSYGETIDDYTGVIEIPVILGDIEIQMSLNPGK